MSADLQNIEDDDKLKKQWGTQWIYKVQGFKKTLDTTNAMWACLIGFLLAIIILLFGGNNPPPQVTHGNDLPNAELGAGTESQNNVNIPNFTPGQAALPQAKGKHRAREKFLAPLLVERPKLQQIPPGLMAKAILTSGASNGPIRAELSEPLQFNGETLLTEGTVLIGIGSSTEDRLMIHFDQIVTKEGAVLTSRAEALDNGDKIAGLKGSKVSGHAMKLAGGIGLGFVGGLTEGLQDSDVQGGVAVKSPSLKNALLNGAATATLEQSRDMMQNLKDKQPIIEVPAGASILVIFESN